MRKKQMQKYVADTDANLAQRIKAEFDYLYGIPRPESFDAAIAAQNRALPLMRELCRRYKAQAERAS